ncbi:MAG: type III-A CRISPR-associated protein Csm2, partial [Thermosynechococcaceae cyanobacterium]
MNQPEKKKINKPIKKEDKPKIELSIAQITLFIEGLNTIEDKPGGLRSYGARNLVSHAEFLGSHLNRYGLKTNQIRKFLDAVKRLKVRLISGESFVDIKSEIIFLEPKLAYAAARKKQEMKKGDEVNPAQDLSRILTAAIRKVYLEEDFYQLVQFVESIVAYH